MQQHENYKSNRKYFWAYTIVVFVVATLGVVVFWLNAPNTGSGKPEHPAAQPSDSSAVQPTTGGSLAVTRPEPGSGIVPGRKDDTESKPEPTAPQPSK